MVLIVDGDASRDPSPLEAAVADYLTGIDLALETTPRSADMTRAETALTLAEGPDVLGVLWVLDSDEGYTVFLYDPRDDRYFRRPVPVSSEAQGVGIESVALIVASAAEALQSSSTLALEVATAEEIEAAERAAAGGDAPAPARPDGPAPTEPETRPEPRTTDPPPEPVTKPPRPWWLALGYAHEIVGRQLLTSPGARIRGGVAPLPRLTVGVDYVWAPAFGLSNDLDTRSTLARHTVGAGLGPRFDTRRVVVSVPVGAELETMVWRYAAELGRRVVGRAIIEPELVVRLPAQLQLHVAMGVAVGFNRFDLVVCRRGVPTCGGSDRRIALAPFRARVRAFVGLGRVF